jgi:transcriptional regulator with XRE-family HTH domain
MFTSVNTKNKKRMRPEVSKKIKKVLIDKDLTLTVLAHKVSISREWLSAIINGHWPGRKVKVRVANFLNIPYAELWGDKEGGR